MPSQTARLGSAPRPVGALSLPGRPRDDETATGTGARGRVYVLIVLACVALGGLSLLLDSTPTYDPWSWIIWGREIVHLDLVTTTGPSWKPLPVLFNLVFSLFGGAAPDLWLVVARAGGLMALAMAFRLAHRLARTGFDELTAGARWRGRDPSAVLAGLVAAVALLISHEYIRTVFLGNSEGILVAVTLWGIERHIDGAHRQALILGLAAALLRPETWPFVGLYGVWLGWREPGSRKLVAVVLLLIPILWFVPEYLGSGNLFRASDRAAHPRPNSPAFSSQPWRTFLDSLRIIVITPIKVGAIVGGLVALGAFAWRRRERLTLAVAVGATVWIGLITIMTQAGYSGNPRYAILGIALITVLAGVGLARVVQVAAYLGRRRGAGPGAGLAGAAAAAVVIAGMWSLGGSNRFGRIDRLDRAMSYQALLRSELPGAIRLGGGRAGVGACGPVTAGAFEIPMIAWYLHRHARDVREGAPPTGTVFQSRSTGHAKLDPAVRPGAVRPVAQAGPWRVLSSCTPTAGA